MSPDDDLKTEDMPAQLGAVEDGGPGGYRDARAAYESAAVHPLDISDRSVAAIYVIEYLWKTLGTELAEFEVGYINPDDNEVDVIGQIITKMGLFLRPKIMGAISRMSGAPEFKRHLFAHQYLLQMTVAMVRPCPDCPEGVSPEAETPSHNIGRNVMDGVKVTWSLVELVANKLYADFLARGAMGPDDFASFREEFVRIVDNKQFLRLVLSVGFSSFVLESAFFIVTFSHGANDNVPEARRNVLNHECFEWAEVDGVKVLKMKENIKVAMAVEYAARRVGGHDHGYLNARGCPAGAAKGMESSVMAEFVKWLIEVAKSDYISRFVEEKRGRAGVRSA